MDIVINAVGMPFDGSTLKEQGLGGSESAAYYQARELARRGHRVSVYTTKPQPSGEGTEFDGVKYLHCGDLTQETPFGSNFDHYARHTPHDVLIIQRHPQAFIKQYAAKVCIHQHHDLALHRHASAIQSGAWQVHAFTAVSEWHRQQMLKVYGLNPEFVHVVRNGVDPVLYDNVTPTNPYGSDAGFVMLYQSRPERGLEHLLREGGIMERLLDTNAQLYVFGYDNTVPGMRALYAHLQQRADALPNVRWMGAVDKATLAQYQAHANLLIYPTEFEEVSCITAMEAMRAKLPILTTDAGALPETLSKAGKRIVPLIDGKVDEDGFVREVRLLLDPARGGATLNKLRCEQHVAADEFTWNSAVDSLLDVVRDAFERMSESEGGFERSAIERSDIKLLQRVRELREVRPTTQDELDEMYSFLDSDEAYAAHYAKHQARYYDEHDPVGEDVTPSPRFRGVRMLLEPAIARATDAPAQVLDYGCAHGHYSIPLARDFPDAQFTGVDISDRAVEQARKWADAEGLSNAKFFQADKVKHTAGTFDAIIAGEVLEHVRDWRALLNEFRSLLAPGGTLILTVPSGRWEHTGTVEFRNGREHVMHFERADLEDIFCGHALRVLRAPAYFDKSGWALGSWVASVKFSSEPLGNIDIWRKVRNYAPRQTIAACLIVKNGEDTLKACVDSFIDWVDEVRIMVDPATTDNTRDIALALANAHPFREFKIWTGKASAQRDGFDAARNESIDGAKSDWILWVDADEVVRNPWNLHKLARVSVHNGFCFKQVHYSADPAQVLTTDLPCRLFRNHRGVKFYGVAHEHPEEAVGKGISFTIARPEIEFLHSGYVDEETRRNRYKRNLPLVQRDMIANPKRTLNKFLLIRDLAQSISFEREQMNNGIAQHHLDRAREVVSMFEALLTDRETGKSQVPHRLLVDSVQYYSYCVEVLGGGFSTSVALKSSKPEAPSLATDVSFDGHFHSVAFYKRFINSLIQESTAKYEERYL